ncbi:hypothetical protein D3C73_1616680 [compost metagenome]
MCFSLFSQRHAHFGRLVEIGFVKWARLEIELQLYIVRVVKKKRLGIPVINHIRDIDLLRLQYLSTR